jgi:hypothetical protein
MGSAADTLQYLKMLYEWKLVHKAKMFMAFEMLRNYKKKKVTIMIKDITFSYKAYISCK